jgi:hypothetical protein
MTIALVGGIRRNDAGWGCFFTREDQKAAEYVLE